MEPTRQRGCVRLWPSHRRAVWEVPNTGVQAQVACCMNLLKECYSEIVVSATLTSLDIGWSQNVCVTLRAASALH